MNTALLYRLNISVPDIILVLDDNFKSISTLFLAPTLVLTAVLSFLCFLPELPQEEKNITKNTVKIQSTLLFITL